MERTFHLTNEFRFEGPQHLTVLLSASKETVAWGPVFDLVNGAHESGESHLTPRGIITLLEHEHAPLRIMAREEWLTDRTYRQQYAWEPARKWREDFDGEICRFALEDKGKPLDERRVIIADPERGWQRAEERLAAPDGAAVEISIRALLEAEQVPFPIRERCRSNEAKHGVSPVVTVLRDILNHEDAIRDSGADITALNPTYCDFVSGMEEAGVEFAVPRQSPSIALNDAVALSDAADVMARLDPIITEKHFLNFLLSRSHGEWRALLYSPRTVTLRSELLARLMEIRPAPPVRAALPGLFKWDAVEFPIAVGDLAMLYLSLMAGASIGWTVARILLRGARANLQDRGVLELDLNRHDDAVRALVHLCYGTRRVKASHVTELRQLLLGVVKEQARNVT